MSTPRINPDRDNMIDVDDGWTGYVQLRPFRHTTMSMDIHSSAGSVAMTVETLQALAKFLDEHLCVICGGLVDHGCVCGDA